MFIAIGNSDDTISYLGCSKSCNKLQEDLNKKYSSIGGIFIEYPCETDGNELVKLYLNNDAINICIINTEKVKSDVIWEGVE